MPLTWDPTTDTPQAQDRTIAGTVTGTDYPAALALGYSPDGSLLSNAVAMYPMEEDSGTTVNDIHGTADASVAGDNVAVNQSGAIFGRSAISFDNDIVENTNDYLISDATMDNNGTEFTVLMWHFFTGGQSNNFSRLFGAMHDQDPDTSTDTNGWWIQRDGSDNEFQLMFNNNLVYRSTEALSTNTWYCHVARGNGNAGSYHVYDSGGTLHDSGSGTQTRTQQNNYFGAMGGGGRYEDGQACQALVLNSELTDAQVSDLVDAPVNAGPIFTTSKKSETGDSSTITVTTTSTITAGTSITVTLYEDVGQTGASDNSASTTLSGGADETNDLTGFSGAGSTNDYWFDIEPAGDGSDPTTASPTLSSIQSDASAAAAGSVFVTSSGVLQTTSGVIDTQ